MIGVDALNLLKRLNPFCLRALNAAANVCSSGGLYEITIEHFLRQAVDDPAADVQLILRHFEVEPARLQGALDRAVAELRTGNAGRPMFSPLLMEWFEDAFVLGTVDLGCQQIRSGALLMALALKPARSPALASSGELRQIRADELRRSFMSILGGSSESELPMGSVPAPSTGAAQPRAGREALDRFTIDLTARARAGQIDPVLGRESEIRQTIDILTRRRKNNPILVGEPGVGKTAVVEGLALAVVAGETSALAGVEILTLDLGLLQAGAGVRGEFENRLKGVIKEVKESAQPIILFIDEAHTIIGAGGVAGGTDAANLLKPALARGELRTIAATTWSEYKKYFEKDAALERRFQPVKIEEPSQANAIVMLRGVAGLFERHHKVRIRDSAVEAAVKLASRFLTGRQLPDKAVDLLDTGAARVALGLSAKPAAVDDLDRRLQNLDSALRVLERDALTDGSRAADLASLRQERGEVAGSRTALAERWEKEQHAVEHVRAVRTELEDLAQGTINPGGVAPRDRDTVHCEFERASEELRSVRGERALVPLDVDAEVMAQVISDWTGIPTGTLLRDEIASLRTIEERLRERVVGQDHAIATIASKIRTAKAGLQNFAQPIGVFLLVGPSGVGKTESALALAEQLFGGERFMVTINMSEYQEKHTVSRLIGSPPGYIGFGEGGVLTEAVRQRPYSVVLLDEVEKADPEVLNLFYQVFDKGMLADGEGRVIDFRNTLFLLTSNLGSDVIIDACHDGSRPDIDTIREGIRPSLERHFKPALYWRMTVIPYYPVSREVMRSITEMKLNRIAEHLASTHGIRLAWDPRVAEAIVERCTNVEGGARNIDHVLDLAVLPQITQAILARMAGGPLPATARLLPSEDGFTQLVFEDSRVDAPR
jgi:type VI secretion system protein VasG